VSPLEGSGACDDALENFNPPVKPPKENENALEPLAASGTMASPLNPSPMQPTIVRLPRNGPKPGQSVEAWLYGKDRNCQRERDAAKWKPNKKGA
jgi:hypothetical protein